MKSGATRGYHVMLPSAPKTTGAESDVFQSEIARGVPHLVSAVNGPSTVRLARRWRRPRVSPEGSSSSNARGRRPPRRLSPHDRSQESPPKRTQARRELRRVQAQGASCRSPTALVRFRCRVARFPPALPQEPARGRARIRLLSLGLGLDRAPARPLQTGAASTPSRVEERPASPRGSWSRVRSRSAAALSRSTPHRDRSGWTGRATPRHEPSHTAEAGQPPALNLVLPRRSTC
jgi:hypothetical protein